MTFGMLCNVRPGDAPLTVEFNLDLRHVEFQRAAFQAATPQHHRKGVHVQQKPMDLRRQ